MTDTPLPFQRDDGAFLLLANPHHRALWSEPGTGKTLCGAVALGHVERSLIVVPAAATRQWARVLQEQGLDAGVLPPDPLTPSRLPQHAVTSWGMLARGAATYYLDSGVWFEVLLLDEAQRAVREEAQRTHAAFAIASRVDRVWPLTGTPIIRYADDLWPVCNALWPDHLEALGIRTRAAFTRRFCSVRNGFVVGSRQFTLQTLHDSLFGLRGLPQVVRRRTLAEVAPLLPPVTTRLLEVSLTNEERRRIDRDLPVETLEALERADTALERDEHVATVRRALGVLKAPEAAELLREAPGKVIGIYWHTEVGDIIERRLQDTPQLRLDGSTSQARRDDIVQSFNRPAGPKVLLLQMVAGGEAINPHENCSHLIFCERDWSGAAMEQALRRVRRMGQKQHQQVDFLDADHPVDGAMRRVSARKLRDLGVITGDAA